MIDITSGINVLSLFDGMSCGQIALEQEGIKVNNYFAAEIDKPAIQVCKTNYPKTIHLGDVRYIHDFMLPKIDLIIGGSPCQGFSFAGKQLNFEDPRSKLFFEYVRLLKECLESNPDLIFMLENVNMKKAYQDIISEHLGVQPKQINSSLVCGQMRNRLYWTNLPGVRLPKDRGINLCDILESGIVDRTKAFCIDANYYKGGDLRQYFDKSRRQLVFEKIGTAPNGKGIYLTGSETLPVVFSEGRTELGKRRRAILSSLIGRDVSPRDKHSKLYKPVSHKKANCLITVDDMSKYIIDPDYRFRKLTPVECERLQTVPDNYTACVSSTQRYRMLGNGWTVAVIRHIFKNMKPKAQEFNSLLQ